MTSVDILPDKPVEKISIVPLLKQLDSPQRNGFATAEVIAGNFSLLFEDKIPSVETAAFLVLLHAIGRERDPDVIAKCAEKMRDAALQTDIKSLREVVKKRGRAEGSYKGGLCDIVGTGGDFHSTFNISTTASIICSSILLLAKHGNRAQTSKSGSADVLFAIEPAAPDLWSVTPQHLAEVYRRTNYAFLFAPIFHLGMRYAAPIRKQVGCRTIFNLLGPLANPVEPLIEGRVVGVAEYSLGPIFADALRLSGVKKAMVVCGAEDLDEISCAGPTNCWRLVERPNPDYKRVEDDNADESTSDPDSPPKTVVEIEHFQVTPADFGLPAHPLSSVSPGKLPKENAKILMSLLNNKLDHDNPILHFVMMNAAALFVVSGICDADESSDGGEVIKERGPGGGRWKEGIRRARWAVESGRALESLKGFIDVSRELNM